jgi:hypothetical protein
MAFGRRHLLVRAPLVAAVLWGGCGGGARSETAPGDAPPGAGGAGDGGPGPGANEGGAQEGGEPQGPPSPLPPGSIPALTLSPAQSGTLPYASAVFVPEGLVPSGKTLGSMDDASLRGAVLSRWPDGSASVVVVASEAAVVAGQAKVIQLGVAASGTAALTPARVSQLLTNVTVDCGAVGQAIVTNFAVPAKVWWATERVICCRYIAPVGKHPTLEAVIDVHAYAGDRALVEIVVENAKLDPSAPALPASVGYTAKVTVNGALAATVDAGGPSGTHEPFRAWYASFWVGGDPKLEVTHEPSAVQSHPAFSKLWKSAGSMATYAADAYAPWSTGRQRATNMGGTGDHPSIGPLPQWEVHYLQSGAKEAQRAVVASALAILTYPVNYRDSGTGLVPLFETAGLRDISGAGEWPSNGGEPVWEIAHHPAAGLVAFMCRPSPVFLEIAQKIAFYNKVWGWSVKPTFGDYYQTRGKAWAIRSHAHALFLTPDGEAWKESARKVLYAGAQTIKAFKDDPKSKLGFVWDYGVNNVYDQDSSVDGFQWGVWQHHYLLVELHKAANLKLLAGAEQALLVEVADWACAQPVRYVNEARGGEFRILYYKTTLGRDPAAIGSLATYGDEFAAQYTDGPPPVAGPWLIGDYTATSYASAREAESGGAYYDSYFWAAFVAGVERDVPGASAAWSKVTTNVTNLAKWSEGFAVDPRWGTYPRNKS